MAVAGPDELRAAPRPGRLASMVGDLFPMAESHHPSSNTGGEIGKEGLQECFYDWLGVSFDAEPEVILRKLAGFVPGEWVKTEYGTAWYADRWIGPAGAQVVGGNRTGTKECHAELTGKWMHALDEEHQGDLMDWAWRKGHIGRVDVTRDDYSRIVGPVEVAAAIRARQSVTHAKDPQLIEGLFSGGGTVNVGKRASDRSLCMYDKSVQSGGEINAYRWELRLRRDVARSFVARALASSLDDVWASELVTLIDFRDISDADRENNNQTRGKRLPWFEQLVSTAAKFRQAVEVPPLILEEAQHWVRRSIGPTLAAITQKLGGDIAWLTDVLDEGRTRYKPRHLAMLREFA